MKLHSILSPVDFSEQSRHALRWAGVFAAVFQSQLIALSVVDPLLAEAARIRLNQDLAKAETEPALCKFVATTWPGADAPAQTIFKTRIGDPSAVIVETATGEGADLIVMGTQGLGGFRKWLLGSTTERVLRRAHVPVLAVPPAAKESGLSSVDRGPFDLVRILATTDFSESSIAAIRYAAQLAHRFSAVLTLAHVVESLTLPPHWHHLADTSDETRVADGRRRLTELAAQFCGSPGCETVVSLGRPADVVRSIAADHRAQLIVMGLTGDQGRFAPRPGSIAYRVLCSTAVPVLVVPASSQLRD